MRRVEKKKKKQKRCVVCNSRSTVYSPSTVQNFGDLCHQYNCKFCIRNTKQHYNILLGRSLSRWYILTHIVTLRGKPMMIPVLKSLSVSHYVYYLTSTPQLCNCPNNALQQKSVPILQEELLEWPTLDSLKELQLHWNNDISPRILLVAVIVQCHTEATITLL